ncbi:Regulatory protein RepA [Escherichia coli]|nr:Regulatory protein RepA [Escherichia coli]
MLALQLAAQIAGGPDLLEVGELPTGPVIYLPAEDPPTAIHHRLHALGRTSTPRNGKPWLTAC